jgi:hypothetical protein
MEGKLSTLIFGGLVLGSLAVATGPAIARDFWHWSEREHRWDHRADLRTDKKDLTEARRQLEYDRNHHASRRKIAEDEARVRDIEHDIHEDTRR